MLNVSITNLIHYHLNSTDSTNTVLIEWIKNSFLLQKKYPLNVHYSNPCLLTASQQISGRGQHGRSWQSPIGNVYLSLYCPIQKTNNCNSTKLSVRFPIDGRLSLCVAYQLSQLPLIQQINQQRLRKNLPTIGAKWVNDLGFYQNNVFQKLAGILIEPVLINGQLLGIVVGVGLNVKQAPILNTKTQQGLIYQAVDLVNLHKLALNYSLSHYYQMVKEAIIFAVLQFNSLDEVNSLEKFLQDFAKVDVLMGRYVAINLPFTEKQQIVGTVLGINENGCLQIETENKKIMSIWTGAVTVVEKI